MRAGGQLVLRPEDFRDDIFGTLELENLRALTPVGPCTLRRCMCLAGVSRPREESHDALVRHDYDALTRP